MQKKNRKKRTYRNSRSYMIKEIEFSLNELIEFSNSADDILSKLSLKEEKLRGVIDSLRANGNRKKAARQLKALCKGFLEIEESLSESKGVLLDIIEDFEPLSGYLTELD